MQTREELIPLIKRENPNITDELCDIWIKCLLQLKNCRVHSFVTQQSDEARWLEARNIGIGGSEIATIAGRSPWGSPREIYMKKTNQFDDANNKQSESARWGNVLESTIAAEWAKRNEACYINIPVSIQSTVDEICVANIDGFVVTDYDTYEIIGILEIKTTGHFNSDAWEFGPLPEYYICQANWYAGITGLKKFTLVCLVGGQKLYSYTFPFNSNLHAELCACARTFWNEYVLKMEVPPATDGDLDKIKEKIELNVYGVTKDITDTVIRDDVESNNILEAYKIISNQYSSLEKTKKALYAQAFELLGKGTELVTIGHSAKLIASNRPSTNLEILKAKYPEAYDECVTYSRSLSLRVK